MNRKNDLFEELNIDKEQNDFCSPLDIDIRAVKQNVNAKLDSAYTERKSYTMKSKKNISYSNSGNPCFRHNCFCRKRNCINLV